MKNSQGIPGRRGGDFFAEMAEELLLSGQVKKTASHSDRFYREVGRQIKGQDRSSNEKKENTR